MKPTGHGQPAVAVESPARRLYSSKVGRVSDTVDGIAREDLTTPPRPAGYRPSGPPPYWSPGEQIQWRYQAPDGASEGIRPVTVVRDDADGLVAWLAPGTPILRPVHLDGRSIRALPPAEAFAVPWTLIEDTWQGTGILMIAPTGVPWSVWLFWNDDGGFRNWYVNLEAVHVRDETGVLTGDRVLDLVVHPDRRYERKDEDELVGAVTAGRHTADEARILEAHLGEVEQLVEKWASPFRDGWESWRPDPRWPVPQLPVDGDR